MNAAVILQLLLLVCVLLASLAIYFLGSRRMPWWNYLGWGILAVTFPILGPVLVILARPGESRELRKPG